MGVQEISLDEILVRTAPFLKVPSEGVWERVDPAKGAVVIERDFGEKGKFYCVAIGDVYAIRDYKMGKKTTEVYVLAENEPYRDAALFAFGSSETNSGPKPKDLVCPVINTVEADFEDFRKIENLF